MIAEYIAEGVQDSPVIRIFGYSVSELAELHQIFEDLGMSQIQYIDLNQSECVFVKGIKSLRLIVGNRSSVENDGGNVEWTNTKQGWLFVRDMLEPLLNTDSNADYHQWLAGGEASELLADTTIAIVITDSSSGQW